MRTSSRRSGFNAEEIEGIEDRKYELNQMFIFGCHESGFSKLS
jgi:hypothetical protein